jgi:O-antigen/teichoic acid export membrane protein
MAPGSWRGALRDLSLKAVSLGLERGCRFVVVVACARALGEATFGRFVFASTVTNLLAFGTDLGLGLWTTRALAREGADADRIVRVGLALRSVAAVPYGLAVAAIASLAAEGEARTAVVLLGVAALASAYVDHFGAVLRGHERFADEARLNTSRALLTTAAGLVLLGVGRSLAGLCAGLAAASVGSFSYGLSTMVRLHPRALRSAGVTIDRALARTSLEQSLPLWFAGLLSLLYFRVDTLFLHSMAGDAELGAYGAAYKLFEGSMIAPSVVLAVAFPRLARAHGDSRTQRRIERRLVSALLAMGLVVAAACLAYGAPIVRVFGRDFGRAIDSLRVLALGLPLLYLNYGLTHFLVARDRGRVTTWLALMMLGLNVGLDVALIPIYRGPGAAWATVLSEVALTAGCVAALLRSQRLGARSGSLAAVSPKRSQKRPNSGVNSKK